MPHRSVFNAALDKERGKKILERMAKICQRWEKTMIDPVTKTTKPGMHDSYIALQNRLYPLNRAFSKIYKVEHKIFDLPDLAETLKKFPESVQMMVMFNLMAKPHPEISPKEK